MPASTYGYGSAATAKPSPAHELKTLVLSRHPLIVVESAEEQRVEALVAEVAADLRVHRFDWTVTRGLVRAGEAQAVYGTEDPATLARTIAGLSVEASRALSTELLEAEMRATVPLSVTRREDIARLRATARERFVPVR